MDIRAIIMNYAAAHAEPTMTIDDFTEGVAEIIASYSAYYGAFTRLSSTVGVCSYRRSSDFKLALIAFSYVDGTFTLGTENATGLALSESTLDTLGDGTRAMLVYRGAGYYPCAAVVTVDTDTLDVTMGTVSSLAISTGSDHSLCMASSQYGLFHYALSASPYKGYSVQVTVESDDTVTWGTPLQDATYYGNYGMLVKLEENKLLFGYSDNYTPAICVVTFPDGVATYGTLLEDVEGIGAYSCFIALSSTTALFAKYVSSTPTAVSVITISGTTVSESDAVDISTLTLVRICGTRIDESNAILFAMLSSQGYLISLSCIDGNLEHTGTVTLTGLGRYIQCNAATMYDGLVLGFFQDTTNAQVSLIPITYTLPSNA